MIKNKAKKCRVCGETHEIDKYGYVSSCIGYYQSSDTDNEVNKYFNKKGEKDKKN